MAITLPLPVRVAAGLLATGIQLVRSLPEEIPAIPVTLVGNAMRLSMKVQQEITTLATRGDELLGGIVGSRPQENPSWATFDEDPTPPSAKARSRPARPRSAPAGTPGQPAAEPPGPNPATAAPPTVAPAASGSEPAEVPEPDEPVLHTPEETSLSDTDTTAAKAAAEVPDAVVEAAMKAVPDPVPAEPTPTEPTLAEPTPTEPTPTEPTPTEPTPTEPTPDRPAEPTTGQPAPDGPVEPAASTDGPGREPADAPAVDDSAPTDDEDDGPAVLPGYERMTLAQVRGHLRELSGADVSALLAYEQAGDNRAPFLTLLSNRLVTLGAQQS